jgi:hypothetical protein
MVNEYEVPKNDTINEIREITNSLAESESDINEKLASINEKLASINEKLTKLENDKSLLNIFLDDLFKFDPNKHVRSATIDESKIEEEIKVIANNNIIIDAKDPSRLPLKTLLSKNITRLPEHNDAYSTIVRTQENYNTVCKVLSDPDLLEATKVAIDSTEEFKIYLFPIKSDEVLPATEILPPTDVFYRWTYYTQVNYEELRKITETLYLDRPDLDFLIGAWDTFEGHPDKVAEEFNKYCKRHQNEFVADIKSIEFGEWTFIADFKKNRSKINIENKNTEVLKRILDRHEEDKKLGTELMKNRIKQKKAKNIAEDGPDAEGLSNYISGKRGSTLGMEKGLSNEEILRLEKAKGSLKAAKELENLDYLKSEEEKFKEILLTRELKESERLRYEALKEQLRLAREMIEVPDDGVQVDVFVNDPNAGTFNKSSFYTKSEELSDTHNI